MAQVLSAWEAVRAHVHTAPGVPAHLLVQAAQRLGRPLPEDVTDLYRASDGVRIGEEDLTLLPLLGDDETLGALEAADQHRSWGWLIPPDLLVLGSDGSDELYGVWAPRGTRRSLVVMVGDTLGEEPALAVVGTSLPSFLAAWTAYHLPAELGETAAVSVCLDQLQVPEALREGESEFDEEHLHALLGWASPDLPDPEPDPYARPVTTQVLDRMVRG